MNIQRNEDTGGRRQTVILREAKRSRRMTFNPGVVIEKFVE
jgi:hypothetical protein